MGIQVEFIGKASHGETGEAYRAKCSIAIHWIVQAMYREFVGLTRG